MIGGTSSLQTVPTEQATSWPSNGNRGSLAARGTLAPATGAPGCVGCSIAGAGHGVPRGEGQGCLGPPHSGIREWLNYSGSVAAGKHVSRWVGWRPGQEGLILAAPYLTTA